MKLDHFYMIMSLLSGFIIGEFFTDRPRAKDAIHESICTIEYADHSFVALMQDHDTSKIIQILHHPGCRCMDRQVVFTMPATPDKAPFRREFPATNALDGEVKKMPERVLNDPDIMWQDNLTGRYVDPSNNVFGVTVTPL